MDLKFSKTGKEIKRAIQKRRRELLARLERRNAALDVFMDDRVRLRSYLIRSTQGDFGHGPRSSGVLYAQAGIASEEMRQVDQLCRRIFEIESELQRLALIGTHLHDDDHYELAYSDLVAYGFDIDLDLQGPVGDE